MAREWVCPYCDRAQVVTDNNSHAAMSSLGISDPEGKTLFAHSIATKCANPKCLKPTLILSVQPGRRSSAGGVILEGVHLFRGQILPRGKAKPQPEYIPAPLREDYYEACLIKDDSPKAAATLARRCLQGMIRNFAAISKPTLYAEITELKKLVDEDRAPKGVTIESVEAIDHVRGVGNIGAHMEKDINVIVPVDGGEAQTLIELVEMLFSEWYVHQHNRQERLAKIKALSEEKDLARKGGPPVDGAE